MEKKSNNLKVPEMSSQDRIDLAAIAEKLKGKVLFPKKVALAKQLFQQLNSPESQA